MDKSLIKIVKKVSGINALVSLFGSFDTNVKLIENEYDVSVSARGNELTVSGENANSVEKCGKVIDLMLRLIGSGNTLDLTGVRCCIDLVNEDKADEINDIMNVVAVTSRGKQIKCKTAGQKNYVRAIRKNSVVIGVGPAGTGKTYLAVALAVMAYKNHEVDKIILTRPAVEAGERLGFLPGDLQTKVDPYLRPLYDALSEMFGLETFTKLLEKTVIEVAPLAYMRGRTLSHAFIILDEAQNTTIEQMKMFLTRMGEGSKIIVNGDVTQIDLPSNVRSGLRHAIDILDGIEGIETVRLSRKDIVRHKLVQDIVNAYEKAEKDKGTCAKTGEENERQNGNKEE